MKEYGMDIELSEDEDYERALEETRQDPEKAKVLSSMIAYQNMGHGKKTVGIAKENAYTMKVLYRLGYHWPQYSFFLFDRFELIFAYTADRAHPIVGKIGERSPGRNTVLGVAHSRVIDPVTYFTYVFVHSS